MIKLVIEVKKMQNHLVILENKRAKVNIKSVNNKS